MPGIEARAPDRTETSSGFLRIREGSVGQRRHMGERGVDLGRQLVRIAPAVGIEPIAELSRQRKSGRDREAEIRHLGEVGALAAEQIAHRPRTLGLAVPEGVHPLGHDPALMRA